MSDSPSHEDDGSSKSGSLEGAEMDRQSEQSEHSEQSDASSHRRHSMTGWASKIHQRICIDESMALPVMSHRKAVNYMCELRNLLIEDGGTKDRDCRMLLLFAGISVQRRLALGCETAETEDLTVSLALLFMLQVLCEGDELRQPGRPLTRRGGRH